MSMASWSDINNALPGQFLRYSQAAGVSTRVWCDLWQNLAYPLPGSDPTAIGSGGTVPTSASLGAFQDLRNAGAGNQLYLYGHKGVMNNKSLKLVLADRLWHAGSVIGNITTLQSVTSPGALTRPDANGVDAEVWLSIGSSAWGGTATTVTVTYTNSAGTGSRTGLITVGTNQALQTGNMFPMRFAAGDLGVQSIQSVQLSPSTGTAGNATIMIMRKVASLGMVDPLAAKRSSPILTTLAPIYNNAALFLMLMQDGSNSINPHTGSIQIIEG